jgi:CRISPR/Cas system-associated endonuclease/helicase Cas3
MTSKEALEQLRDKAQLLALFMGKDAGDYLVNVDTLYNTSKQDLERLERLQQELKVCEYFERNLIQENEKLKKAIEEILEYAKCELDSIEVVDKIERILIEVLGE